MEAPDESNWSGQRDRVLFALMYNTGTRVSEAIGLRRADVTLSPSRTVRINGKGRKQRVIPLWGSTADCLQKWLPTIGQEPESRYFRTHTDVRSPGQASKTGSKRRFGLPQQAAPR